MPMLMPNPNTISKSLQNITKTGINLDEIVRHSIKCDVKSTLKKRTNHAQPVTSSSVLKSKAKLLLQENNKSKIARNNTSIPPVVNGTGKIQRSKLDSERPYQNRTKSYMTKRYPLNDMNFCQNVVKKEQFESKAALTPTAPQDDSLTSLQWLTGVKVNDILEGKPIQYSSPPSPATSTSSDELTDEKSFIRRESRYYSVDYRQNHEIKPPYSYAALIIMAMKSKGCGKMTLSEIYKWISDNFLYYRNAEPTWQNSIRHNLSLNKCFAKIPRKKGDPGKGGYWSIVPEFANKLLENSIRKRRSNIYDYEHADSAKRQRLDILESQLLCKLKSEFKHDPCSRPEDENPMLLQQHQQQQQQQQHHHHLQQQKSYLEHLPVVTPSPPPLHPLEQASPVEIIADMEHCRMDHPYGKSPVVNYNVSDEENIRAIASHLEETTSNVGAEDSIIHIPPNNSIFNTFSSAIRTDCIWSSEQHLAESMGHVTNELLEAQELDEHAENGFLKQLNNSLNNSLNSNSSGLAPALFCLSPPISGDDDRYSDDRYSDNISDNIDDLDNQNDVEYEEEDEEFKYLRVRGTSMTLFEPTPEMIHISTHKIKEEPLSPNSIDLNE